MRPQKKAGCETLLANLAAVLFIIFLAMKAGTGQ